MLSQVTNYLHERYIALFSFCLLISKFLNNASSRYTLPLSLTIIAVYPHPFVPINI